MRSANDVESARLEKLLTRIGRAGTPTMDMLEIRRAVFGTGGRRGLGLDRAVAVLRGSGFRSVDNLSRAVHLLADQEVAP
jgi:hypothetical protein